ncbi:MAG TPA: ABC transporter substrate-binding protein [Burkholderiales bacterium]|nr:ABC transporter substrate-binding protein [Burkholderiales bacterium]
MRAAKQATSTIPIVMTAVADAVGSGLVASLPRSGANVTGMSFLGTEIVGKQLDLLKQAMPPISRVAVLRHLGAHAEATAKRMRQEADAAARAMELSTKVVDVSAAGDLNAAFDSIARDKADALLVWASPMFLAERKKLIALSMQHRLPTVYHQREFPQAGGLTSYGPNLPEKGLIAQAAAFEREKEKPREGGAHCRQQKMLLLLRLRGTCASGRRCEFVSGELTVLVLIQLVEILLVRCPLRLFAGNGPVLVLVRHPASRRRSAGGWFLALSLAQEGYRKGGCYGYCN